MGTAGDVRKRVGALLGDPDFDWLTQQYFYPMLQQVYEQQISYLTGTSNPFDQKRVFVGNLDAGTTDLTPYFKTPDKPLYGLYFPRLIWWKQAGLPENYYRQMQVYNSLPDLWPSANGPASYNTQAGYEWRGNFIFITPFAFNIDLRVLGDFLPSPLTKDADVIGVHPMMVHPLAYGTAALIAAERGNQDWVQAYSSQAMASLDEVAAQLVRQQQKNNFRVGRIVGGRGNTNNII